MLSTSVSTVSSPPPAHYPCLYYGLFQCESDNGAIPRAVHFTLHLSMRNTRFSKTYTIEASAAAIDEKSDVYESIDVRDEQHLDFLVVFSTHRELSNNARSNTIGLSSSSTKQVILPTDTSTYTAVRVYVNSNLCLKSLKVDHSKHITCNLMAFVEMPNVLCSIPIRYHPPAIQFTKGLLVESEAAVVVQVDQDTSSDDEEEQEEEIKDDEYNLEEDDDENKEDEDDIEYVDQLPAYKLKQKTTLTIKKPKRPTSTKTKTLRMLQRCGPDVRNPLLSDMAVRASTSLPSDHDAYNKVYACSIRFQKAATRKGNIYTSHVQINYTPEPNTPTLSVDAFVVLHRVKTMSNPCYREHFRKTLFAVFESPDHAVRVVMSNPQSHLWVRNDALQCVLGVYENKERKLTRIEVWARKGSAQVQKIECLVPLKHFQAVYEKISVDANIQVVHS
jgi:hypothetical protein